MPLFVNMKTIDRGCDSIWLALLFLVVVFVVISGVLFPAPRLRHTEVEHVLLQRGTIRVAPSTLLAMRSPLYLVAARVRVAHEVEREGVVPRVLGRDEVQLDLPSEQLDCHELRNQGVYPFDYEPWSSRPP